MKCIFTLRIIFVISFLTTFSYKVNAQNSSAQTDSVKRVIVVVRPGYTDRSTYIPNTSNSSSNTHNTPNINSGNNSDDSSSTSSSSTNNSNTDPAEPVLAPTTAERSGTPDYMKPVAKKHKAIHVNVVPQTVVNNTTIITNSYATPIADTAAKTIIKHDTVFITKTDTILNTPPKHSSNKILFLELGGPGLAISINYDQRLSDKKDGWGYRVGTGYFGDGGNTVFTVPLQINYLLGSDGKYFEFGGGTTFINTTGDNKGKTFIFDRITGFIGTATIGVRYEPQKSVNFRLGFVPVFSNDEIVYAGGFSVGYTF